MIDSCWEVGRDKEACELVQRDIKDLQNIAIYQDGDNMSRFDLEQTSLVENRIDCGEEEFGNDFNASLQSDDGIAGDHFFDCADYF